jgi:hypothetical protein
MMTEFDHNGDPITEVDIPYVPCHYLVPEAVKHRFKDLSTLTRALSDFSDYQAHVALYWLTAVNSTALPAAMPLLATLSPDQIQTMWNQRRDAARSTLTSPAGGSGELVSFVVMSTMLLGLDFKEGLLPENFRVQIAEEARKALDTLPQNVFGAALWNTPQSWVVKEGVATVRLDTPPSANPQTDEEREEWELRRSLTAIASLLNWHYFRALYVSERHMDALRAFHECAVLWEDALIDHFDSGFVDLDLPVRCLEDLFANASAGNDWEDVAQLCLAIAEVTNVPEPTIAFFNGDGVTDSDGEYWDCSVFWQRAAVAARARMSPDQVLQAWQRMKATFHAERLQRDFLDDNYGLLDTRSREALLRCESTWFDLAHSGGRSGGILNDLRHVFEAELNALIFSKVAQIVERLRSDKGIARDLRIDADLDHALSLADMSKLLEAMHANRNETARLRRALKALGLTVNDMGFLLGDLPPYLHNLVRSRNVAEHPRSATSIAVNHLEEEAATLRRKALGIGCVGVLPQLLDIKKRLNPRAF